MSSRRVQGTWLAGWLAGWLAVRAAPTSSQPIPPPLPPFVYVCSRNATIPSGAPHGHPPPNRSTYIDIYSAGCCVSPSIRPYLAARTERGGRGSQYRIRVSTYCIIHTPNLLHVSGGGGGLKGRWTGFGGCFPPAQLDRYIVDNSHVPGTRDASRFPPPPPSPPPGLLRPPPPAPGCVQIMQVGGGGARANRSELAVEGRGPTTTRGRSRASAAEIRVAGGCRDDVIRCDAVVYPRTFLRSRSASSTAVKRLFYFYFYFFIFFIFFIISLFFIYFFHLCYMCTTKSSLLFALPHREGHPLTSE